MGWLDWLMGRTAAQNSGAATVDAAIEHLVDAMDPRLRLVDGYVRKLRPAVTVALARLELLVAAIPGPVEFSRASWGNDALVKAFFATPQELARTFSAEPVIQEFFAAAGNALDDQCCVALFVSQDVKTTLGYALQGEVMLGDVVRHSVSFTAHRLTRPAATDAGVRASLRDMGLHYLANQALERITGSRNQRQMLEEERGLLRLRLNTRSRFDHALESLLEQGGNGDLDADGLRRQLEETEQRLASLGTPPRTLDEYLVVLQNVLEHAADYVSIRSEELRLDSMNILVDDPAGKALSLKLCELRADGRPPRAVVIARFPRRELLSRQEREAAAFQNSPLL